MIARVLLVLAALGAAGAARAHDADNVPESDTPAHRAMGPHAGAVVVGTTGDGVPVIHRDAATSHDTASAGAPRGIGPADDPSLVARAGDARGSFGFDAPARVVDVDEGRPVLGHGPHSGR